MIRSKVLNAIVGLTFAVGVTAGAQAQEAYIPLISKGFQHQFWQAVKAGAMQAAKDYKVKVTFEGPETEAMVDKQIDMLSAAIAKKPAALGFAALDSKAALPLLKKAQAEKIPVIAFDSGVDSDIPVTTAATNNKAAASLAADKLAALIGDEGEVAVVAHDQTSRTGIDRRDGFLERMKSAHPKVRVVTVQYGEGDQLKSTEVTKSILQAYPKLKGLFGTNEGSAIGVVNGVREMKRKVVIVGYDSGKQQKDAIRSGLMAGAITQNPIGIGYKTVEAAVKAIKGEKLPKVIDTGFYWYDKTNIDDPKISAVLYD
ncbi:MULTISPECIES: ABC transporter substrate-binding protein [Burkholderia]|uniref:Periplasmic binding protein/LacI transcriptional regulator n=1 Tax=Burkholderia ambifaria (strain MC40-6) TaxID=398577 RepID=B1YZL1_BURA4|nr:ABC transporter substrate-binding protein [Burkholderia ambifaria]MDP9584411.1 ribose transport system substrate-binding protein [Burkholderia contaminans]ACB67411.1 periplasmic binding protein/LacI transcriptional regulator [Burkholderia ambifaria MC40-6]MBR8176181.1 ABC transporter substrate-binding protein [Burkholderia ambifaria]MBR8183463.1 ABC transporter substrate-binding protein [Burkholderia ambifaria]MBR8221848.1 ABC transporter substrate-binding protein [Burkholderia ambifaria]